ncbi:hypothetical protein Pint_10729 [Pistacia integerrima]|uniref:Uncharacterized protein n=1 Tax=Pistacia integerrima TaxID=434235 RepID=A0ACC0XI63_9ROSI|nr:hypothetical protein Pint_10729 [Pistacia integerrima]
MDVHTLRELEDKGGLLVKHAKFIRIYVEIDLQRKLLLKFKLGAKTKPIEYEGLHFVYFSCGIYGHRKEFCPSNA